LAQVFTTQVVSRDMR